MSVAINEGSLKWACCCMQLLKEDYFFFRFLRNLKSGYITSNRKKFL